MEDKLLKILKIKIDAIDRNIDNLNYLNGELDKNNENLDYIDSKIYLFKDNDILKFEEITREDFSKIISMVNSTVSEVFKDKACSYEGIIYIIEGIKKSISLELTNDQKNAIETFVNGMKEKRENLLDTINNLTESKSRLPETDLTVLTNNLDIYNNMVSKFENTLYLTEIDELAEALNYSGVDISEKSDMFEYILKYNANIYSLKENEEFSNVSIDTKSDFETPNFNYDEVKVTDNLEKTTGDNSLDEIKFNLDNLNLNNDLDEIKKVTNEFDLPTLDTDKKVDLPKDEFNFDMNYDTNKFNNFDFDKEIPKEDEDHELNTLELNDIIKKIDDKLKEIDNEEKKEDIPVEITNTETDEPTNELKIDDKLTDLNNSTETKEVDFDIPKYSEIPSAFNNSTEEKEVKQEEKEIPSIETYNSNNLENQTTIDELNEKYSLPNLNITSDLNEVDKMLQIISDNDLMDLFKNNKSIFESMLNNYNSDNLVELIKLIKENLIVKEKNTKKTFEILLEVMPILFTKSEVLESFKENIKFFKEKNINLINIFDNYRELLIMNNKSLVSNYNKVSTYGFNINSDNVKYLLYNKNVLEKLDYFIEAKGYEKGFLGKEELFDGVEYIVKNPYKINSASRDMLLKLSFASENGLKIYGNKPGILSGEISNPKVDTINITSDYLNSHFSGNYSFIDKAELISLKDQLNNLDEFDMTIDDNIAKLDANYKKDELKYVFDNNTISRTKTIRIYNYLKDKMSSRDAMIIALTFNSVLENSEYEKIVNIVSNLLGGM